MQTVLVAVPLWVLWVLVHVGCRLWKFAKGESICTVRLGSKCLSGDSSLVEAVWKTTKGQLWLLPLMAVLCWLIVWAITRWPKRFWLFPALIFIGYIGSTIAFPSTRIERLPYGDMADAVYALAEQEGFDKGRVGIVSETTIARVEGLGSGQSIVFGAEFSEHWPVARDLLWQKTVNITTVRAIAGHELGHVQRNHTAWQLGFSSLVILLLGWTLNVLLRRYWPSCDEENATERVRRLTALPLLGAAALLVFVANDAVSRVFALQHEHEADRVGLDIARDPDGFAQLVLAGALGGRFELTPVERWLTKHPSNADRIRTAIAWQQRHRSAKPIAVPDIQRFLVPAKATPRLDR